MGQPWSKEMASQGPERSELRQRRVLEQERETWGTAEDRSAWNVTASPCGWSRTLVPHGGKSQAGLDVSHATGQSSVWSEVATEA